MTIRRFEKEDADSVSEMICLTLRTSNARDYSGEYLKNIMQLMRPEYILRRAAEQHFYVVEENGVIIGSGAVGAYREKTDESCFYTVFVHPDYQGRGIGRRLIETLEQDAYFLRAKRVEIPASITAVPFYLKMGYTYKNGKTEPDAELLIRLEKHRV